MADASLRNAVAAGLDVILGARHDVREQECIDAIIDAIRRNFVILPADTVRTEECCRVYLDDQIPLSVLMLDQEDEGHRFIVAPSPNTAEDDDPDDTGRWIGVPDA